MNTIMNGSRKTTADTKLQTKNPDVPNSNLSTEVTIDIDWGNY